MLKIIQHRFLHNIKPISVLPYYSTKPALQEKDHDAHQIKELEKISRLTLKRKTKKPQKPPFVKNLFVGKFDVDMLTYPELHNEELKILEQSVQQAQTVFQQYEIKDCNKFSKQLLKKLSKERLLGLQADQLHGGLELSVTEMCRFFEVISEIKLKNLIMINENLGMQTLQKFGSEYQKKKYLEHLICGNNLSSFCVLEPFGVNIDVLKRTAHLSSDGKFWILNGEKKCVPNGNSADFYIVLAHTNSVTKDEIKEQKFTTFLVERNFGGMTTVPQKMVDENVECAHVMFENTQVPIENVIGSEEMGESILTAIYPQYRLSTGPLCCVLTKNLIKKVSEHFLKISQEPYPLYESDAIRSIIGELTTSLYAIESMVYLTTGLMDNYENQDCELESTVVKVFASEQAFLNTSKCLDLLGPESSMEIHWCSQFHKEALSYCTQNDTNDSLKIIIGLFGIRYAGQEVSELIQKLRNPLHYASFIFKRMWTHNKQFEDKPKLNLYLHHYLHPSLITPAQQLEYCVLRLQFATETFLSKHGQEVVNRHIDLKRLAECVIDIYAMTSCLGRASRSYCIGLQHAEYEITLATSFCFHAMERVRSRLQQVIEGTYQTTDENYRNISDRLFRFKGYFPVHPLTRNF